MVWDERQKLPFAGTVQAHIRGTRLESRAPWGSGEKRQIDRSMTTPPLLSSNLFVCGLIASFN